MFCLVNLHNFDEFLVIGVAGQRCNPVPRVITGGFPPVPFLSAFWLSSFVSFALSMLLFPCYFALSKLVLKQACLFILCEHWMFGCTRLLDVLKN